MPADCFNACTLSHAPSPLCYLEHSVCYTAHGYAFHLFWTGGSASALSVSSTKLSPESPEITGEEKDKQREENTVDSQLLAQPLLLTVVSGLVKCPGVPEARGKGVWPEEKEAGGNDYSLEKGGNGSWACRMPMAKVTATA